MINRINGFNGFGVLDPGESGPTTESENRFDWGSAFNFLKTAVPVAQNVLKNNGNGGESGTKVFLAPEPKPGLSLLAKVSIGLAVTGVAGTIMYFIVSSANKKNNAKV
jgi:hypothetical protein